MHYEDFVVQLDGAPGGDYRARVVRSPAGEGSIAFRLPFDAHEASTVLAPWTLPDGSAQPVPYRSPALARHLRPRLWPVEAGSELYDAIFQGRVRTLWDKSRARLDDDRSLGLRLKIKLDPTDPATAALADLPFELLHDRDVEESFALSRQTSLIRYLEVPRRTQPIPISGPLRVLAVSASPSDLPPLDLGDECRRLQELAERVPELEVSFLHHASAGEMRDALASGGHHVLHFMGHGDFDPLTGEGFLYFERPDASAERVGARTFAARLRDLRSLGLVTLNACNTGRASHRREVSPFRGVATALVLGGLPGVVAMQHPISDAAAIGFSSAFYRCLGRGLAIDAALTEGRQAILSASPGSCEWAIPVLFLRIADGDVFLKPSSPQTLRPGPAPAVSTLRLPRAGKPLLKVAATVGGAALLSLSVYAGFESLGTPGSDGEAQRSQASPDLSLPDSDRQNEGDSDRQPVVETRVSPFRHEELTPRENRAADPIRKDDGPSGASESKPPAIPDTAKERDRRGVAEPIPAGATPPMEELSEDSSALASRVVRIERRSGHGLRVWVAFRNQGDRPLSLVLDGADSKLADNLGKTHGIRAASLPTSGSATRLDLPARGGAEGYFDFPAPELKAHEFTLVLATSSGQDLEVSHEVRTIQGPP